MVASSNDEGWQRLTKPIDMTGKTTGDLKFKISYDTEADYDFVVVEAHTVGEDDWTTLEEVNGGTSDEPGASCDINWDEIHDFMPTTRPTPARARRRAKRTAPPKAPRASGTRRRGARVASWTGSSI